MQLSGEGEDRRVTTRSIAVGPHASDNHVAKAVARLADLGMVHTQGAGSAGSRSPTPDAGLLLIPDCLRSTASRSLPKPRSCGNSGFVQTVRTQLMARGVPAARVHSELFSPNDWLLS